MPQGQDKMKA